MSTYTSHRDLPYSAAAPHSPRQALDLFLLSSASPDSPLLVFIHGGAWRSESKEDFVDTLVPSLLKHVGLPLAVLEYRLAPLHPHPAQINDVLSGLSLLTGPLLDAEGGVAKWSRSKLVVAGHSVGAFMAASLVLTPPASLANPSLSLPSFSVPSDIRQAITSIICIDGIYDLPSLLAEYPTYSYFVDEAFPAGGDSLAAESPARWVLPKEDEREGRRVKVLVLHSKEDELLSLNQPRFFLRRLKQLLGSEVSASAAEASADVPLRGDEELDLPDSVEVDFDSVKGTHEGLLKRDQLAKVIALRLR